MKRNVAGKIRKQIEKKVLAFVVLLCISVTGCWGFWSQVPSVHAASQEPDNLYAQSAVLMDADSGRILFSKNGGQERAMASTTKIMTCIIALEYGKLDGEMAVSQNAASQPKVHLGVTEGDKFLLRDLLYSLMLESHNDSAVIIAENIGKTVEGFADMMNAKAKELGCVSTYFITPNGLDAEDTNGIHHTTAEELARIMKYCIMDSPQKEMFLEITRTPSYQFTDCSGKKTYSCTNHNAFLQMMDGALSGKTGFTGEAGYCYIGSLERDGRTFIVALLACGWPNNKTYKWTDMKKLMNYALDNYQYRNIWQEVSVGSIQVDNGIDAKDPFAIQSQIPLEILNADTELKLLLRTDEQVEMTLEKEEVLKAPIEKGEKVGRVKYTLNGNEVKTYDIVTASGIKEKTLKWYFETVFNMYMLKNINVND